jgi:hypothetical protein
VNGLYPGSRPVRHARVPTGPHELVLLIGNSGRDATGTLTLGCECTSRRVKIDAAASDAEMWYRWLTEVKHDPKLPAPKGRTAPNAVYR